MLQAFPAPHWRPLLIGDAAASGDTNAILVSASDTASGVSWTISPGASTPDPHDGAWWTWEARDVFGRDLLDAALTYVPMLRLREDTSPGLASSAYVALGWADASDLTSANYIGGAISYDALRTARRFRRSSPGAAVIDDDTGPVGTMRQIRVGAVQQGDSWGGIAVLGLDAAGDRVSGDERVGGGFVSLVAAQRLYFFGAVGWTALTAAGNVSGVHLPLGTAHPPMVGGDGSP